MSPIRTTLGASILGLGAALAGTLLGCADESAGHPTGEGHDPTAGSSEQTLEATHWGSWGPCGPSPLSEPVPAQVIQAAEQALRPGGYASPPSPELIDQRFTDPTKCQRATLGHFYRRGTVDTSKLNGSQTHDSFVLFYDLYRVAWYCDGRLAGDLEIKLNDARWEVIGHGAGATWEEAINRLEIDFASACTPGYLENHGQGPWIILPDQTMGLMVRPLFSGGSAALSKGAFIDMLDAATGP